MTKLRSTIAATLAIASLGVGALALAPAAGASVAHATTPKEKVCQRAHDEWQKIVAANDRAVHEYHQLRDRQQQLLANGHALAAHRLDVRLDAARRRHDALAARVLAIAARVKSFCTEQAPALAPLT